MATTEQQVARRAALLRDIRYFTTEPSVLLRSEPRPTLAQVAAVISRLDRSTNALRDRATEYCGQDGHLHAQVIGNELAHTINHAVQKLRDLIRNSADMPPERLANEFDGLAAFYDRAHEVIDGFVRQVPIDWDQVTIARGDRLTATLFLRDVILPARARVDIVDRYLDETLIDFMRDLPRALSIRMITTIGDARYGVTRLMTYARVARSQYPNFSLIQIAAQHAHMRCVRVDNQIFRPDQSIKDLALHESAHFPPPIVTAESHAELDAIIAAGQVVPLT